MAKSRLVSSLQSRVDEWLLRLSTCLLPEITPGLTSLSSLKRNKHKASLPSSTAAPRLLLRLLTQRVVALSLSASWPELLDRLAGPPLTSQESEIVQEIAHEINQLEAVELESWTLAGLYMGEASPRRSGSFYTGPELARYITHQTLSTGWVVGPVLDPACGGGAFLLAALERLAELEPGQDAASWLVGRLYGLDLNSFATTLTRLALLRRLSELTGLVSPRLALALLVQVRTGNALVGSLTALPAFTPDRAEFFAALHANQLERAWAAFLTWEAALQEPRCVLAQEIANLPIFNEPEDGPKLAALHPFSWQLEFPEVWKEGGFAAVLGNPPYVGFNDYSGIEKAYFAHAFRPVYNLKSDLLYYFIQRGIEVLRPAGRLGFVTSRFWKEAAFAAPLRRWLGQHSRLLRLEDRGTEQLFSGVTVDTCLLFASREQPGPEHQFAFCYEGREEWRRQTEVANGAPWVWLRRMPAERALLAKITEQSCTLGEVAQCRTGVQTGLDRVFLVDETVTGSLEKTVMRRAIKNGNVGAKGISWSGLWLIYPPANPSLEEFPALLTYLHQHRPALERRRRYDKPFAFYELQWPRVPSLFEASAKLVTPYKAPCNTFALDTAQFYFSTDVVSIVFEPEWTIPHLTFAANFLNSRLSTFQFRSYAKPVGGGQWDYYANPVKRLAFPRLALPGAALATRLTQPGLPPDEADELVFDLYQLSAQERTLLAQALQQ